MLKKVSIFTLLFILLLFLGFFLFLKNGIKLDNLSLTNINISQLYLKLDKKLIFTVETLEVISSKDEKTDSKTDFDPSIILTANDLLDYVGLVRVDDLNIDGEHLFVKLENKELFVKHKLGEANVKLQIVKNDLQLKLNAKSYEYGSNLDGKLNTKIDTLSTKLYKPVVDLSAVANHKDIKLALDAKLSDAKLKYTLSSNEIKSLEFIKDFTKLEPSIKKLVDKFKFSTIQIQNLNGKQDLEKLSQFDLNSINANVKIKDIDFKYEQYPRILQKEIVANLSKGNININIKEDKKEKSLSLSGDISSSIDGKNVAVDTKIFYKDIVLKANIDIKDEVLNYKLSSNRFKNIKDFEDFIEIPAGIRVWAMERLSSKATKIDNVSGKLYLNPFDINLDSLRVKAKLYDINMDFNPGVAYPLNADVVYVDYDGKDMNINLDAPRSNDVDLKGSDAVIYNMLGSNNGLLLRLQSVSPLNWTLVRVVQSYGVSIPNDLGLRQTKGSSDIKVKIDIPFSNNPVDVYVKILNTDSTMKIKDNLVDFKTFDFLYKDKKVILKDTLAKYELYNAHIKDMLFDIDKSSLDLKLTAYDDNSTFELDLKNQTNLKENTTNGTIDVKYVDIKDMVNMKKEKIPYMASFGDDIDAKLPTLGIMYKKEKKYHLFKVDEFKRFEEFVIPLKKAGVERSSLQVESRALKDVDIKLLAKGQADDNKTYEFDLNSNINLDTNTTNGFVRVYDFTFDNKVDIKHKDIPYKASFSNVIKVDLPTLYLSYENKDKIHHIAIDDFSELVSLVKLLEQYDIPKASLSLKTKDFKDIDANLNVDVSKYGVFYKKKKQNEISLDIAIKQLKEISLKDKKEMLKADIILDERPSVDVVLNDLGVEYIDDTNTTAKKEDTNETKEYPGCEYIALDLPIVNVDMKNGYFRYNKNLLNYDEILVNTNKDKIDFNLNDNNSSLDAKIDDYKIALAVNLEENFINNLAGLNAIDGGAIDLNARGTHCKIDGDILLNNVAIKKASILNKVFLVVNSAPVAINPFLILADAARFAGDGFNLSEYRVDEGDIEFSFDRGTNILDISKLESKGVHNSFYGQAQLDLTKSKIDATLEVSFMQGLAKVISYIPAVGYWVLGDDERFSYSVDIKGDLTNPDINTHVTKETALAPVNIVKRVVTYPAKLVEYATSEDDNSTLSE